MCGIAGYFGEKEISDNKIKNTLRLLSLLVLIVMVIIAK